MAVLARSRKLTATGCDHAVVLEAAKEIGPTHRTLRWWSPLLLILNDGELLRQHVVVWCFGVLGSQSLEATHARARNVSSALPFGRRLIGQAAFFAIGNGTLYQRAEAVCGE